MENSRNRHSTERLVRAVKACLRSNAEPGQHLAVAFSGGLDSSVLLDVLCRYHADAYRVSAIHIHHGLNADADEWATHCARECHKRGISLIIKRVSVNKASGQGLEASARLARYRVLASADADRVLLAHHQDDQAETVLHNLLRGAGILGAAAMPVVRGRYLRPLLGIARSEIREYAEQHDLAWIEDSSNADDHFTRNFLRNQIFSQLTERFPAAHANLARAAQGFIEANTLLEQLARVDQGAPGPLKVERLRQLNRLRALNLLAFHLRRHEVQISGRDQLQELLRQLSEAASDRQLCFQVGGMEVRRYRGEVCFVPALANIPGTLEWSGESIVSWGAETITIKAGASMGVRDESLKGKPVRFLSRRGGEKIRLRPDGPCRPLKDLLREAGIAPWQRDRIPLMYCGSDLVWVPGIGIAAGYQCTSAETGVLLEFSGVTW